jgi:hypothetical protein
MTRSVQRWGTPPYPRSRLTAFLSVALVAAGAGAALLTSCVATTGEICVGACSCPSEAVFTLESEDGGPTPAGASVSEYMARRCGTLDCHGAAGRPMRLYGRFGLRDPAANDFSGGKATTPAELVYNYTAVCSIQPEQTQAVTDGTGDPESLLILQKARGIEAHKGGAVVAIGSPGDNCIYGWLRGDPSATVAASCQAAIDGL